MGSSTWSYFVPYQSDIGKALDDLREQVFCAGSFYIRPKVEIDPDDYKDATEEIRELVPEWIEREKSFTGPKTITDLLEWNGEEGTHSALDITRVSDEPAFGTVNSLSKEELVNLFGTDKPDRAIIGQGLQNIWSINDRWRAIYIVVYKDNVPDEILFAGVSGD